MRTSKKQTLQNGRIELTLFQEDSHANLIPLQVKEKGRMMTDISGQKCLEQLGKFNQVGSWVKMFTALLIGQRDWFSMKCKLTWKLKGTKYSRMYCQLVPPTLRTEGIGFGLLLTPTATQRWCKEETEIVITKNGTVRRKYKNGKTSSLGLSSQLERMLPTPRSRAAGGNCSRDRGKANLEDSLAKIGVSDSITSQLNPRFVAEMMGFPPNWTELPFQNGEQKV